MQIFIQLCSGPVYKQRMHYIGAPLLKSVSTGKLLFLNSPRREIFHCNGAANWKLHRVANDPKVGSDYNVEKPAYEMIFIIAV